MNKMNIIRAETVIVCNQCGALVLESLKNTHGSSHSTFGTFSEIPHDLLITYASPEDLKGFKDDEC